MDKIIGKNIREVLKKYMSVRVVKDSYEDIYLINNKYCSKEEYELVKEWLEKDDREFDMVIDVFNTLIDIAWNETTGKYCNSDYVEYDIRQYPNVDNYLKFWYIPKDNEYENKDK